MENRTEELQKDLSKDLDLSKSNVIVIGYNIIVPILIMGCFVTFMMNLFIISSYPFIRNLTHVSF